MWSRFSCKRTSVNLHSPRQQSQTTQAIQNIWGNVLNFNLFQMLNDNDQFRLIIYVWTPVEVFKSSAIWFSNRVDLDIDERTRPNNQTKFILLHIVLNMVWMSLLYGNSWHRSEPLCMRQSERNESVSWLVWISAKLERMGPGGSRKTSTIWHVTIPKNICVAPS